MSIVITEGLLIYVTVIANRSTKEYTGLAALCAIPEVAYGNDESIGES